MMRTIITLVLFTMMWPAQASEFWATLWRNADQRGETLLQQGDASSAASVYTDPRRKAYAKLKAGDYAGAVQDLKILHDGDSDYNRGNALAHTGKLQDALDAYDAALKTHPNNQDARHNRELVENALKQQAPQQQKSGGNKSQDDKKQGQRGKESSGPGNQDDKGKQGEHSGKDKNGQQGKPGQSDDKAGKGHDSSVQNRQEQQGNEGQKYRDGAQSSAKNNAQAGQTGEQASEKNESEQAQRDAEASLAKPAANGKDGEAAGDKENTSGAMHAPASKSEQQIAQEQWLRSIPDDPSGLLRRKFLIEHMMRQQKAQQ